MIYNIYKPVDWTSFDVVKKIRGITRISKVGHAGTLDPFAEGVLIIGTGQDTKNLSDFSNSSKSYCAVLLLGAETDSGDVTGVIRSESEIPELTEPMIVKVFKQFLGKQSQIPPMYSAKRVDGKRLYELARKNIEIKRDPISIFIHSLNLEKFTQDAITFNVTSSKGTYIRTLGEDIAKALGTKGYLKKLTRTAVGNYAVEDAISLHTFETVWKQSDQ
ncbi:tRNA pseudouridine(55) synthase TruB [Candidatus Neomarinimicrobiota bacterium]